MIAREVNNGWYGKFQLGIFIITEDRTPFLREITRGKSIVALDIIRAVCLRRSGGPIRKLKFPRIQMLSL